MFLCLFVLSLVRQNRYWISYSHCETGHAPVPGVYSVTEVRPPSRFVAGVEMLFGETGRAECLSVYLSVWLSVCRCVCLRVTQLSLHLWHDIAFSKLKKRVVKAVIHIFHTARHDRSACFEDGDCIASTVEVGACCLCCWIWRCAGVAL